MPLPPLVRPVSITPYLACSPLITCTHPAIRAKARELVNGIPDENDQILAIFTYVRDQIAHSVDADENRLVWEPSQIISAGHALCFGKSHLFVALCRTVGIPAGFCYQRVKKDDNSYVLHGLAAVRLEDPQRWIRVDPRGNKPGINAQFDPHGEEQIAYPDMDDPAEWLDPNIYAEPWDPVIHLFESSADVDGFILASAAIEAQARHPPRMVSPSPVPV